MSQGVPVANQEDIRPEDAQEGDALIPQDARSSNKSLQSSEGVVIENLDGTIQHGK